MFPEIYKYSTHVIKPKIYLWILKSYSSLITRGDNDTCENNELKFTNMALVAFWTTF